MNAIAERKRNDTSLPSSQHLRQFADAQNENGVFNCSSKKTLESVSDLREMSQRQKQGAPYTILG